MSTYAQLEADLFLAERAFKRVPSDENKETLAKVKAAFGKLSEAKEQVKDQAKAPVAPKTTPAKPANTAPPKVAAPKAAATKTTVAKPEDPKKN
jgi:hypothetical protein